MTILRNWTFTWWEIAMIKVCLLSLGLLLSRYFYEYLIGFTWLWWILFVVNATYFIVRAFRDEQKIIASQ